MPLGKPPPLPPRRHVSQTVTLAKLLDGERPPFESFPDEEEPTAKKGDEIQAYLLVRYWRECAPEDRAYLVRLAEQYAARNRKD